MKKLNKKAPKVITDLKNLVISGSEKFGDKVLYEYKDGVEVKKYTHNDLLSDMNALGTALDKRGFTGKTIAVIGDTSPFWTLTYLTTVNGNGIIVPLDKELSLTSICDFLKISDCSAIAYTGSFNGKLTSLSDSIPGIKLFIRLNKDKDGADVVSGDAEAIDLEDLINEGNDLLDSGYKAYTDIIPDMNKCCAILFTSGTTGTSKGVMLSQKNLTAAVNSASICAPYDDKTSLVSVLPIHHTYEFTCTHLAGMNVGVSTYINPSLKYASRSMQYYKPSALVVVPMFLETVHKKVWAKINESNMTGKVKAGMNLSNALLKVGVDMRTKLFADILAAFGGNVRSIICGGAPVQSNILKDLEAFGITVYEGYGITECSPLVAVNPNGKAKFGSVGTPVCGCEVMIDPASTDDSGRGEILVKGDNVMLGYYNNPEATAEVFTEDGWFRTGDIGYIDRDGYIFITGRKKNVIILSNGKNVYPEELEENLMTSEYVKEIVVIGRKDENDNETEIIAVVFPDYENYPDTDRDELKKLARESLIALNENMPSFKQASDFEFRETEFEKTTTKKIKRFLVK